MGMGILSCSLLLDASALAMAPGAAGVWSNQNRAERNTKRKQPLAPQSVFSLCAWTGQREALA
jgi:hypothetical protein